MRESSLAILVLVLIALVAFIGLWTVLGYDFTNGKLPELKPGKAYIYPETMKITQEVEPQYSITYIKVEEKS